MGFFNLLFVLPDEKNENILCIQSHAELCLPCYDQPVGDNVGFDEPQLYNDFFRNLTGISVFRKYSFNTGNFVVFVFEQIDRTDHVCSNEYAWTPYSAFIEAQQDDEVRQIALNVRRYYRASVNMPWVSCGFSPYFAWLNEVCSQNNIHINGEIEQIKNAYVSTVFRIPTDAGNLYMKMPGMVYIHELPFTHELKKFGITNLPDWIGFDSGMNVYVMRDMGGMDLPAKSGMDVYHKVIFQLAKIQKASIRHLPIHCRYNDYTLNTILHKLNGLPLQMYETLSETAYAITQDELRKLEQNVAAAGMFLMSVKDVPIPNTIQNGDVRPGNIRVVDEDFIFYDWSWGAVSHPFVEVSLFLHVIRRELPTDVPAKELLVKTYLNEWLDYGSYEELKRVFEVLDDLKELFMAYPDHIWVQGIHLASTEPIHQMSADGWLLERRNYYFSRVLKRFIEKNF